MRKGIGELLVRESLINIDQLEKARQDQKVNGGRLMSALVRQGYVDEESLVEFLGQQHSLPTIELQNFEISQEVIDLIPQRLCIRHGVIPVQKVDRTLVVAFSDPSNVHIKDDLALVSRCKIEAVIARESSIIKSIEKYYESSGMGDKMGEAVQQMEMEQKSAASVEIEPAADAAPDDPIVQFVDVMLSEAIKNKASDIHIEVYEKSFRIRFRIDGILQNRIKPPQGAAAAIVSRIKIMCKMNIAEKRLPQDGALKVKLKHGEAVDFRVSCLPTLFGEKVVLRVLDKSNLQNDLTELGFEDDELELFKNAVNLPQGMVLITGPTGSGKTTTIYSALKERNNAETNISTAENPVEFNIEGINQVQINPEIGFEFATALKSFLRQDPDVIMLGEIRDYDAGSIAYKAAATGHLVVSTLHTNDAAATITRLLNMNIPSYIIADSTSLVVAQRLVKTNCKYCSEDHKVKDEVLLAAGVAKEQLPEYKNLKKGLGCINCNDSGYAGRSAIFEVMNITTEIKEAIYKESSPLEIKRAAIRSGMRTLRQSALLKLKNGLTTVTQVLNTTVGDDE